MNKKEKKKDDSPRAYTEEEARKLFLNYICGMISYWNGEGSSNVDKNRPCREKMEGLVHSILVFFDGGAGLFPSFDIVCVSNPEDEKYLKEQGENWFPNGLVINNCQLHDEYNAMGRRTVLETNS
jgi:hypothetical protein